MTDAETIKAFLNWRESYLEREPTPEAFLWEQEATHALYVIPSVIEIMEELTIHAESNMILKSGIAQALEELRKVHGEV